MEACLQNGEVLKKILSAIGDLVTDGNFECTEKGITLQAMDSSHVSLVSMILRAEGFNPFKLEQPCSIGLHLENMNKVLKCMGPKDELEFKHKEGADDAELVFRSPNEEKVAHFSIALLEIESESLGIPDTEYKAQVKIPATEFQRICRDFGVLGDSLKIAVSKDNIQFSVNGEVGKGQMTLRTSTMGGDDDDAIEVDCIENVTQTFAMRYLNLFTKATGLSSCVRLSMSPEVPLMVEYAIEEIGYVRYYLAPKIDDDI